VLRSAVVRVLPAVVRLPRRVGRVRRLDLAQGAPLRRGWSVRSAQAGRSVLGAASTLALFPRRMFLKRFS